MVSAERCVDVEDTSLFYLGRMLIDWNKYPLSCKLCHLIFAFLILMAYENVYCLCIQNDFC